MAVKKNTDKTNALPESLPVQCPALLQSVFLQLQTREGMYNMQLKNILYCSSDNSLTTFHTLVYKQPVIVSKSLNHFEALLRNYGFERVHNKRLVNLTHILRCHQGEDGYALELTGGEKIGVSRAMKKNLAQALKSISINNGEEEPTQKNNKD